MRRRLRSAVETTKRVKGVIDGVLEVCAADNP